MTTENHNHETVVSVAKLPLLSPLTIHSSIEKIWW